MAKKFELNIHEWKESTSRTRAERGPGGSVKQIFLMGGAGETVQVRAVVLFSNYRFKSDQPIRKMTFLCSSFDFFLSTGQMASLRPISTCKT